MTTPDQIPQTDPVDARELAAGGALLLDVREPAEWSAGHIEGAVHTPLGELDPMAFDRDRMVVAVCRSGNRSGKAAAALADAGVDVRNLAGGMTAWSEAGLPCVDDDGEPGTVA
ncbi:rhodanese-like domain-containing protein [Pseudonocardia alni]|jgi:rhodanese-related sulfurtransferase|uniref:Rhodanese-related sulfurtransferase n=1 Tax=Pseudonocardia alni TaxID=33907 RepID=A0AA44UR95_PSEA5|nr:rhodanese-like domain-containing protein [Pseudonocardia alni]PKB31891.1 rhodanese-related sulfurtransferase [Pseudonocardia alni]